uniref:CRIM domain-containing protein n=1 Tax=Trichuris muris TaxID=70415 RepID=A0A5S6QUC5_TRIMR
MASWHSKQRMVNLVRYTFSAADDTGICAAVLPEPVTLSKAEYPKDCGTEVTSDKAVLEEDSPDVCLRRGHRRRSNTVKRLDALQQQRRQLLGTRVVQWQDPIEPLKPDAFPVRSFEKSNFQNTVSYASRMILEDQHYKANPFKEYLKFDESFSPQPSSRSTQIFLPMLQDESQRQVPLNITISRQSKVHELIGLVCYHYTANGFLPPLKESVEKYALYVAEENGEIDYGLPARSPMESVAHFHFPCMAMAERSPRSALKRKKVSHAAVHFDNGECFLIDVTSSSVPLKTIRDKATAEYFAKFSVEEHKRLNYKLEKLKEPGVELSLDATFASIGYEELYCLRENSSRRQNQPDMGRPSFVSLYETSPVDYVFQVTVVKRLCLKCNAELHISPSVVSVIPTKPVEKPGSGRLVIMARRVGVPMALERPISMPHRQIVHVKRSKQKEGSELFKLRYQRLDKEMSVDIRVDSVSAENIASAFSRCSVKCETSRPVKRLPLAWSSSRANGSTASVNASKASSGHAVELGQSVKTEPVFVWL